MRRTPGWTVACLPVDGALPEHIVEILIGAQSAPREAGVKHRTVVDSRPLKNAPMSHAAFTRERSGSPNAYLLTNHQLRRQVAGLLGIDIEKYPRALTTYDLLLSIDEKTASRRSRGPVSFRRRLPACRHARTSSTAERDALPLRLF
jgi:hypothetical protein